MSNTSSPQPAGDHELLKSLYARIRELEELYERDVGVPPPPSSLLPPSASPSRKRGISNANRVKSPRKDKDSVPSVAEMAPLTHPIVKKGARTGRDSRVEVLVATQADFVAKMQELQDKYVEPLAIPGVLQDGEWQGALGELPALLELHCKLLEDLEARTSTWEANEERVGDVLLKHSEWLRASVAKFDSAKLFAQVNFWRTNHPNAKRIDAIIRVSEETSQSTLRSLIMEPTSRVYNMLECVRDIVALTAPEHIDSSSLKQAVTVLEELNREADEQATRASGMSRLRHGSLTMGRKLRESGQKLTSLKNKMHKARESMTLSRASSPLPGSPKKSRSRRAGSQARPVLRPSMSANNVKQMDVEPLMLRDAVGSLLNPEGCEEEFAVVMLTCHPYFASWNKMLRRFAAFYVKAQDAAEEYRMPRVKRLVEVVVKWLRVNAELRGAYLRDSPDSDENFSLEDLAAPSETLAVPSSDEEEATPLSPSPHQTPSVLLPPPTPRSDSSPEPESPLGKLLRRTTSGGVEEGRRLVMKSRGDTYDASASINSQLATDTEAVDAALGLTDTDGPPLEALRKEAALGKRVYFVTQFQWFLDHVLRNGASENMLRKYWAKWKKPRAVSSRGRRNSIYYRNLQKSTPATATLTDVLTVEAYELAKQLTIQDLDMFKSIEREELYCRRFLSADTGPNFQLMVLQFNVWSSWPVTEVLARETSEERARVIAHLVEVAYECTKLHNYNASYALVAGLNHPALTRMRATWEEVPKKSSHRFDKLMSLWEVSGNFRVYRNTLKETNPPLIPYLGLLGKDLYSIEENNPTFLSEKGVEADKLVINFRKLRLISGMVKYVTSLQGFSYSLEPNEEVARYLSTLQTLDEALAKEKSRKLEPRATR